MRAAIISFVIGVACLQQQAALLDSFDLTVLAVISLMCIVLNFLLSPVINSWLSERIISSVFYRVFNFCAKCLGAAGLGFVWASAFAHFYLVQELPTVWEGKDITVVGTVDSLPFQFEQGVRFNFLVEQVLADNDGDEQKPIVPSKIALSWYAPLRSPNSTVAVVQPGERWRLKVRLKRPHGNANPDSFDYEVWLLEQGLRATGTVRNNLASNNLALADPIETDSALTDSVTNSVAYSTINSNQRITTFVWSIGNLVERGRAALRARIHAALPGHTYAGVLVALVVGDQREVAQSDWKVFNRTSVGHLFSISGLHITMVAGLFAGLIYWLWRHSFFFSHVLKKPLSIRLPAQKAAALAGVLMALIYVALAGFGVPAQRTLYMLSVVALALWCGRLTSISHVLCLALGVVVVLDPWAVLWPGFWLSFGAVGIILFASVGRVSSSKPVSWRGRLFSMLRAATFTQYVVTIGLVPLTLLLFGQLSFVGPVANMLAIPLVSFIVTPLALLGSVLPAPMSSWVLELAHICVEFLARFLDYLSTQSFAVFTTPMPPLWMVGMAMLGVLWLLAPRGWPLRWLGIFCCLPLISHQASQPVEGEMTVTALDVGQGMSLLIETAHHRLLYDTGPSYSPESDGGSRVIVPYLRARGISSLDGVMISHNDSDHSGGALSIFKEMQIAWVSSSLASDSPVVLAALNHRRCLAGQAWSWDGVEFEVLQPASASYESQKWKPNARSCTLKISTKTHSMLLAGDIEAIQEDELVNSIPTKLRADVLLAPHHGSGTSSTPAFLQTVQPQLAVFQVGYLNRYHHPKPEVFQRYADFGIKRLRTDEAGAITLQFGTELRFSEYRSEHRRYWYQR